jgi:CSLREA domain-containing protein
MVCAAFAAGASSALASTFTVNTTADTSDSGGCTTAMVCSLRDAVAAANATAGSTINLPAGDYKLNTGSTPLGQLALTAATTITGAGARTTIVDGNGDSRVFDFEPSTVTDTLTLQDLTVTGGSAPATATVTDQGDGGGIFSLGGLDLQNVAVTGNTAALGGGGIMDGTIHSGTEAGPATFTGVTIANNTVKGGGGNGQGGGAVVATTLTMTNSTIADNEVDNPGVNEGGGLLSAIAEDETSVTATLVNDTIVGNVATEPVATPMGDLGGGISGDQLVDGTTDPDQSVLNATNTIVADNTADGTEQDCALIGTTGSASSHNIEGDSTCGFTDSGSKETTAVDLGKLADNGGPTDTLVPTSTTAPEVNTGTSTGCPATDQRGVTRPQGSACDIGAVELAPPTAATGPSSALAPTAATAAGTAGNPAILAGTATIDYGTATTYGHTASAGSVAAGPKSSPVSARLSGLEPNTTYHYRLVVTTTDGTATGSDATFKTPAAPTATSVSCKPSSVIPGKSTTCTAKVRDASGSGVTTAPTGTVKFSSSTGSPSCKLSSSRCSVKLTGRGAAGSRAVKASYSGDSIHATSTGSTKLSVAPVCPKPSGALSGIHLGAAQLGLTRAAERKRFFGYSTRGRKQFDFFCSNDHHGIRVGYSHGRAVLILTSNALYHLGKIKPGSRLATAERDLKIYTHFKLGLNTWYLASGESASGVLKVRHGQVQEIGLATKSLTSTPSAARTLFANIP